MRLCTFSTDAFSRHVGLALPDQRLLSPAAGAPAWAMQIPAAFYETPVYYKGVRGLHSGKARLQLHRHCRPESHSGLQAICRDRERRDPRRPSQAWIRQGGTC